MQVRAFNEANLCSELGTKLVHLTIKMYNWLFVLKHAAFSPRGAGRYPVWLKGSELQAMKVLQFIYIKQFMQVMQVI